MQVQRSAALLTLLSVNAVSFAQANLQDVRVRVGGRTSQAVPALLRDNNLLVPLSALADLGLPIRTDDVMNVTDAGCLRIRPGSALTSYIPTLKEIGSQTRMMRGPDLPVPSVQRGDQVYVPLRAAISPFGFQVHYDSKGRLLILTPPDVSQVKPERATCALALAAWLTGER